MGLKAKTSVLDMAIYRAPRASRISGRRVLSPIAQLYVAEALRVLSGESPGLVGDDALAERERARIEHEAAEAKQTVLPLACPPAPCGDVEAARAAGSVGEGDGRGCSGSPVDGSSLDTLVAGDQTRIGRVDSGRGSY